MRHQHENFLVAKILENYNNSQAVLQTFYKEKYLGLRKKLDAISSLEIKSKISWATEYYNEYFQELKRFARQQKFDTPTKMELRSTFFKEMILHTATYVDIVQKKKMGLYDNIFNGFDLSLTTYDIKVKEHPVDLAVGKKMKITIDSDMQVDIVVPAVVVIHRTILDIGALASIKRDSDIIRGSFPNAKIFVVCDYMDIPRDMDPLKNFLSNQMVNYKIFNEIFFCRCDEKSSISPNVLYSFWTYVTDGTRIPNYYIKPFGNYIDNKASCAQVDHVV